MSVALASNIPLPPGFKFRPTNEELINDYLKPKIMGDSHVDGFVATVDLYKWEPGDLPGKSKVADVKEWYFFCRREKLRGKGKRFKRKTNSGGFWKSTCREKKIIDEETKDCIAIMRTLVCHTARGHRTKWILREFALSDQCDGDSYVICSLKENKKKTKNKADTPESLESESNDDVALDKIPSPPDAILWENGLEERNHGSFSRSPDMPFPNGNESSGNISSDSQIHEAPAVATQVVNRHVVVDDISPLVQPLNLPDCNNNTIASYGFDESDDMQFENLCNSLPSLENFFSHPMPSEVAYLPEGVDGGVNISVHQLAGGFPNSS